MANEKSGKYRKMMIQPWDVFRTNPLGFLSKYMPRRMTLCSHDFHLHQEGSRCHPSAFLRLRAAVRAEATLNSTQPESKNHQEKFTNPE
jgi:hypothetical protein